MLKIVAAHAMGRLFTSVALFLAAAAWAPPILAVCPSCDPEDGGGGSGGGSTTSDDGVGPESLYEQRMKVGGTLQPLSDTPFGEQIDLYSGGITFEQTDVSLPGVGPAVAVTRSFSPGRWVNKNDVQWRKRNGEFGDWVLELPRITTMMGSAAWNPGARCSQMAMPDSSAYIQNWYGGGPLGFSTEWWWNGYNLVVPGKGAQQLLKRAASNTLAPTGLGTGLPTSFPLVTKQHWMIACLPSTSNGQPGEGFLVVDPSGTKYWMDWLVFKAKPSIIYARMTATASRPGYTWSLPQYEASMLPSRIEDRFGNYVTYSYSGAKLTAISSSDGRALSVEWRSDADLISKITAQPSSGAPRAWTYQYQNPTQSTAPVRLSSLTQPDSRQWIFNLENVAAAYPEDRNDLPFPECKDVGGNYVNGGAVTITHPSGVVGTFQISSQTHGKSYVPLHCVSAIPATGGKWALSPAASRTPTLLSRSLAGPSLPAQTWTYQYSAPNASFAVDCSTTTCPTAIWTKVTEPDSSSTTYTFSNRWGITEGQLLSSAVSAADATTMRSANQLYNSPSAGPYPAQIGTLFTTTLNTDLLTKLAPLNQRTVQQDGDTYTWQALAFDRYGNAVQTKRFNSIPGQTPVQEQVTLANDDAYNQAKWVLGQVKQKVNQTLGQTVYSTTYNANGLPQDRYSFGLKVMSYTWDAQGRLSTFKDGLNRTTTLSNYRFDIPRLVTFADNSTRSAVVSDFGEVTSLTNENGATTSYQYDSMGLLLRTDYPSGDTVAWAPTITTYSVLAASELGMPVGTWRARTTTGRSQTSTYYDARWRPVLVEEKDTTTGKVAYKRTAYDHESHHLFDSYPSDTYTATAGTNSVYDALGRPTLRQTTDGVTLNQMAYLTGAKVQTTDADGKITTIGHQVFDSPAYGRPIRIEAPENQLTVIERDLYGKITGVTQSGIWSGGSVSATQTWTYDAYQRLCRKTEPETGSVILGYDAASQLKWQLKGQSGTGCVTTQPAGATLFGYDTRGRKTLDDEPGTADDVSYGYDAAGNPTSVTNPTATWTYGYNKRGLVEIEQAVIDGKTFVLNPTYDSLAHVQSLTTPARTITYAPDAWGRPTQVGTWATGVQYYANGLPKNYTLGNGLTYLQTLNSRQWPQVQTTLDGGTVVQRYQYSYSDGGDLLSIDDDDEADNTTLAYDNLHRLKTATGLWGTYGYVYDPLNNIRSRTGPNALTYSYNASNNRLSSISGSQSRSYSYNAKGEVTGDGTKSFTLNAKGQIQTIAGIASYGYDGNGKRIKTLKGSNTEYALYDLSGRLVYTEQGTTKTDYLSLNGQTIVELKKVGSTTTPTYLHPDLLGSPRRATNAAGTLLWDEHYDPYGSKLNGVAEKIGYTGHAFDPESNLTYMQARFFDPLVGRFLSTDPVYFTDESPFTFNRYSYANNNPYRFTDPSGMCVSKEHGDSCSTAGPYALDARGGKQDAGNPFNVPAQNWGYLGEIVVTPHGGNGDGPGIGTAAASATAIGGSSPWGAGWLTEALGTLSRAAPYLSAVLLSGDTPKTDMYRHYGFTAQAANFSGGLRPYSFATTASGPPMTGMQAQRLLALPHAIPPDAYYTVIVPKGFPVVGPTPVLPEFGQPGGGIQYRFPGGTPPGSIYGPFPIPRE